MRVWRLAASAAVVAWALPAMAEPPPASAFGRIPAIVQAAISPDGKHVAMLGGPAEDRRVSIATIDKAELPSLRLGDLETIDLTWAGDKYVIATVAYLYKDGPRRQYRIERNIVVDTSAKAVSRLLDGAVGIGQMTAQPVIGVVDGPAPKAIISGGGEIWRADVESGRGAMQESGQDGTFAWDVDSTGQARVRLDGDAHDLRVMGRPKGGKVWRPVWQGEYENAPEVYYGYSDPEDAVYLYQEDAQRVGHIVRKRLADGAETIVGPAFKDSSFFPVWDRNRNIIVGFGATGERATIEWIDPEIGGVHATLQKLFKDKQVDLMNWSKDRQQFILKVTSPSSPSAWYIFDKPKKEVSPIEDEYPELKGVALGTTRWITYKARDGLEMSAYLTLPPGATANGKAPLVVMPHGGPELRDDYQFDFMVQYLATRGYAVLQPQFRGSSGFGRAFQKAGEGEWGGKMQTDLLDGVAAAAATGAVDPSRVCIVGASFGGYAALAGAAFHSDAYRCAASFAGISELGMLSIEEGRLFGRDGGSVADLRRQLGHASPEKLAAASPEKHVADIHIPILLIHGDKDTVVAPEQSELMANALKAAGKPYDYVVLAGENHYLTKSATRTQMLETVGAFLAKNLPVSR